ncbi:MAG: hypothetical protein Q8N36_03825 [bacterium]|nr:hypothetical protein [bacterium]
MAHDKPTKKVRGRLSIVEMIDVVENNELTLFSIKRIGEKSRGALPSNCWNGSQTDIEGIVYV